jgi:DNA-binding transcriptional ArsR family regulator
VETARNALSIPVARRIARGEERPLLLEQVEALFSSKAVVVDGCRHVVRGRRGTVTLERRPILFQLAKALAEAWPEDAARDVLLRRAFGGKLVDESHRARLRVEVGRLRRTLRAFVTISATKHGFALKPRRAVEVVVLAPPVEDERGAVLAFLADGESWSSSALALALGASQRTVQRALDSLLEAGKVRFSGRARAQRWMTLLMPGLATTLLLPERLAID